MLKDRTARIVDPVPDDKGNAALTYRKLNWNNRIEILRFILTLDDYELNRRFNYGRKIASIFAHYNNVSFKTAKFFAASKGSLIGLAELYSEDEDWTGAELVLTVMSAHSIPQIYSELAHLAIMELARQDARSLTLCHQAFAQTLHPYFDSYDILDRDDDFIRLAL